MKNPSPWIAASIVPPVVRIAPWVNCRIVIGAPTPNPTWVSPRPAPNDSVTRSWKETVLLLKPVVLRFARLFPTTEMAVDSAASAESAVEKDANMKSPLWLWCRLCAAGGAGGRGAGQGVQILPHLDFLFERAKLRQLRHELSTVLWLRRVLVLQLRH